MTARAWCKPVPLALAALVSVVMLAGCEFRGPVDNPPSAPVVKASKPTATAPVPSPATPQLSSYCTPVWAVYYQGDTGSAQILKTFAATAAGLNRASHWMIVLDNSDRPGASVDNQIGTAFYVHAMNPGTRGLVLHSISFNATEAGAVIASHTFTLPAPLFMTPNQVGTWNFNPLSDSNGVQVTDSQIEHSACQVTGWS